MGSNCGTTSVQQSIPQRLLEHLATKMKWIKNAWWFRSQYQDLLYFVQRYEKWDHQVKKKGKI